MATLAKSQNVCTGCRSRKKKCNGDRPSCSLCLKRGDVCFYAGAPSQVPTYLPAEWLPISDLEEPRDGSVWTSDMPHGDGTARPVDWPSIEPEMLGQEPEAWIGSIDSVQQQGSQFESSSSDPPGSSTTHLSAATIPPQKELMELVDLYFEKFYSYMPILHRSTLMSKLKSPDYDSHLLLFSIIAVTASAHPNREIQQAQIGWYNEARSLFSKALHSTDNPLQTILSANFIIFQAMILTEYSTAWMFLGSAWRLCVACNLQQQDREAQTVLSLCTPQTPTNWITREECRRAVWLLFIFDRGMCFPVGLTHAIDDRQLRINFPMDDDEFQAATTPPTDNSILYTSKLDRLITLVQGQSRKKTATLMQFIVLAYVFLGRVCERIYTLDDDSDEQRPHIDALTSHLLRIRLMLPRSATSLSAANYSDFTLVTWLSIVLNTSTILLYHKPLHGNETHEGQSELATNWPHCVAAARNSVSMIRDASRTSTEIFINPHLSSKLFTCGRIIVMEYLCPSTKRSSASPNSACLKDPALRDDIEVLLLTFERMREALKGVGRKFRNGLVFCLREDKAQVLESKACGSSDLLRSCVNWPVVDDDEGLVFSI